MNEADDVHLQFARELAMMWKTILHIRIARTLVPIQEDLISKEVERAWGGSVSFDRELGTAIAISSDGFQLDLLTGVSRETSNALEAK